MPSDPLDGIEPGRVGAFAPVPDAPQDDDEKFYRSIFPTDSRQGPRDVRQSEAADDGKVGTSGQAHGGEDSSEPPMSDADFLRYYPEAGVR